MNYIKRFESHKTNDEIIKICQRYNINNYIINSDGSIDVDGDVDFSFGTLTRLPLKFNKVYGDFDCSYNELTTLEGAPIYVYDSFWCGYNKLTTLKDGPQFVDGIFNCQDNELTTLEGAPQFVYGLFRCDYNKLTTLEGGPQSVNGHFRCFHNQLTTLEGGPQSVKGHFDCSHNQLTTLKGVPQSVGDWLDCSHNKDLKSLEYLPNLIDGDEVHLENTTVYEIFELLDNDSIGMIRLVKDLDIILDDKINIEILNDLLYDQGKPPVEKVKGYDIY